LLHLYFHMIYIDFRRKLSLFASLFTVSILIPFFLHPNLISPVEGERWRGSFPPFEGEEVIFTSKVEKWKSFFLHSPSFLLHSSSFLHPHLVSPVEGERWRESFPPFKGEEVIFTPKVEKWKSFFLHSPSFLLHSSSFILHYPFFVFLYLLFWRHIFYYFRVDF